MSEENTTTTPESIPVLDENFSLIDHSTVPSSPLIEASKKKRPTAAESLAKQKAADKAAKEKAKTTPTKKPTAKDDLAAQRKAHGEKKARTAKDTDKSSKRKVKALKNAAKTASGEVKPGRQPKVGLRLMQIRALNALQGEDSGLTLTELAKKAKISNVVVSRGLGTVNPDSRPNHDERNGFKSLLTLGHVRVKKMERGEGDTVFVFTLAPVGEKAFTKAMNGDTKLPKVAPAPFSKHTPAEVAKLKKEADKAREKSVKEKEKVTR